MKMAPIKKLISRLPFILFLLIIPATALAAGPLTGLETAGVNAGFNTAITSPEPIIASAIKALLSFLGVIFLILTIYGGVRWMTAQGNEEEVKKAKSILTSAVIGIIIVFLSYAITVFVTARLVTQTGAQF